MKYGKQELNKKISTHIQLKDSLKDPLNRLINLIKFHNFV